MSTSFDISVSVGVERRGPQWSQYLRRRRCRGAIGSEYKGDSLLYMKGYDWQTTTLSETTGPLVGWFRTTLESPQPDMSSYSKE